MITTKVDYQNSSKGNDVSALMSTGLPGSIDRLFVNLSLRSLLSVVKIEKFSKDKSGSWIALCLLSSTLPFYLTSNMSDEDFEDYPDNRK